MGMRKKQVITKRLDFKEILRVLALLEQNNMNKSITAQQCGISRASVMRYEKKHWEDYLREKSIVRVETIHEQAEALKLDYEMERARQKINDSFEKAIFLMDERLADEELRKKISNKDLAMYISNLAPFLADKLGAAGLRGEPNGITNNYTAFVNNFMTQVGIHKESQKNAKE